MPYRGPILCIGPYYTVGPSIHWSHALLHSILCPFLIRPAGIQVMPFTTPSTTPRTAPRNTPLHSWFPPLPAPSVLSLWHFLPLLPPLQCTVALQVKRRLQQKLESKKKAKAAEQAPPPHGATRALAAQQALPVAKAAEALLARARGGGSWKPTRWGHPPCGALACRSNGVPAAMRHWCVCVWLLAMSCAL